MFPARTTHAKNLLITSVFGQADTNKENHQIRDDVIMFRQFFKTNIYKEECIVFSNRSYLTAYFDRSSLPLFVKCVK